MKLPKFSFSLPVYNEEKRLGRCLESIVNQDYPKENIEILVVDGGSKDRTKEIASAFECVRLFDNAKKLADFGAKISMREATGDLFVIFAADNDLAGSDWLSSVAELFIRHKDLYAVWGRMISGEKDSPVNRYYELIQNDPLSFFVNKNLDSYIETAGIEKIKERNFYIFDFDKRRPLIWGANGLVYRADAVRDLILREEFTADNDVFQMMAERYGTAKLAYSKGLNVYHHHVRDIFQWIKKWQRNYIEHYLNQRRTRNLKWICSQGFMNKLFFWTMYSFIPIFSIIHSAYLAAKNKNRYWFYHPLVNFAQALTYSLATISTEEGWHLIRGNISLMFFNKIRIFRK